MSKVITFSKEFPKHHPRAGQPTEFLQKLLTGFLLIKKADISVFQEFGLADSEGDILYLPKFHTIRAGHRWKKGDAFSPRQWSAKPYQSSQTVVWQDTVIESIFNFDIIKNEAMFLNGVMFTPEDTTIPMNDGLSSQDFIDWFDTGKDFSGQLICWSPKLTYSDILEPYTAHALEVR
jgi:hypothetical protein